MLAVTKNKHLIPIASLTIFLLASWASGQQARTLEGRVIGVHDGDTMTVLDAAKKQWKIRLAGIDAPELKQAFGQKAKQELSNVVYGREVRVTYDKTDRYGRIVGVVYPKPPGNNALDGIFAANLWMVRSGFAWHYKQYQSEQTPSARKAYAEAENEARRERFGIWSEENPTPPWEFRNGPAKPKQTPSAPAAMGPIIGNKHSRIYHLPGCPAYNAVSESNRVYFRTRSEADAAGYRIAKNCTSAKRSQTRRSPARDSQNRAAQPFVTSSRP